MTENLLIQQDSPSPTVEPCPKCGAVHWMHEEKGYGFDRMKCLECDTVVWGFVGVLSHEPALATWNALSKERQRLQAELKEQALQYLSDTGQLGERVGELTEVLEEVDAWVEGLGYYADDGADLVPVFKKVKAVLGRGYK